MKLLLMSLILITHYEVLAQSCKASTQSNLAAIASTVCSDDSLKMIDQLKAQGFRCDSPSESMMKRGILCKGKIGNYSQPVRIYVSPNYQKKSPASINLHFHGHRLNGIDTFQTNQGDTLGHGDYGARLVDSKSNDLLVIPESTGKCANYDTELNDQAETKNFINALEQVTGLLNASYKLTAHSGGAKVLNKVLSNESLDGRVKSVGLFDAIYEDQAGVKKYLKASVNNRAVVNYLENGTTQKMTSYFLSTTKDVRGQVQVIPVSKTKSSHMSIINQGPFSQILAE